MIRVVICAVWALSSVLLAVAQTDRADAEFVLQAYTNYRSMAAASPFVSTPWQYLGPTNISGRATDIAVAEDGRARRIYAAFATSGVWASDDGGRSWGAVFQHEASTSIGDVAVAPSAPSIVWVGTGEANLFRASMPGVGLYKSTDAGRTFVHAGLADSHTIGRIVIHPANPDIVYVAASGHAWTENETRGVFKTTDGGRTWARVLYRSARAGAIDLVMDPAAPETLYAATWERIRRKWSDPRVEPGFSDSGLWKSTDGGATWRGINEGLPEARFRGRIGLDIARTNSKVLYAFVDSYEPGRPPRDGEEDAYGRPMAQARIKGAEVYRTDDAGASWRRVSENTEYMTAHSGTYGWVFGQVRVHPTDENTIYTLGLALNVSRDAGRTFSTIRGMHGDHHGLWIDPARPATVYNANDGGVYVSEDGGASWHYATDAGGVQFYNVAIDSSTPAWAYGSIQDQGSRRGHIDLSKGRDRIPAVAWTLAPGGEGSHHAIDPDDRDVIYSHGFYGNFTRTDLSARNAGRDSIRGTARRGAATAIRPNSRDVPLRAQWMAPIITSQHRRGLIYAGYQFVYRSPDRGRSWARVSPDLTSNDPLRMLLDGSGAVPYQTITALAESPRRAGVLYAGTDDGRLHVTRDDGRTWVELTARVPSSRWYSRVVPSRHADGTVFVTQRGREDDDFGVYVYRSNNYGRTFTSIGGNLPAGSVNVIREDPANPRVLYAGTDFGVFVSTDGGVRWEVLGGGLPSVQVSDLAYHERDRVIVAATYGRGMYVLDATGLSRAR